jgi:isopenicillin N synthase-like dioxygenase
MPQAIPVLSLQPILTAMPEADARVARQLEPILKEWGAFQLVDHGVDATLTEAAFAAARRFFAEPLEQRLQVKVDRHNRGYVPMHQTQYPGSLPDLKESFNLGTALTEDDPDVRAGKPLHGVNRWPDLPDFRSDVTLYFDSMLALGDRLLGPLALCLGMTPEALRACYKKPIAFMRLFHYPPEGKLEDGEYGAAEHKDYGFLTILAQDAAGGLEVRAPDDSIVSVPPRADAFVVNLGDMVEAMTGGALRSAPHRVINRAGIGRYSIPFFYDPAFDARFAGLPEYSAGEFLLAKFSRFYKNRESEAAGA